jgi:hypothetical protein
VFKDITQTQWIAFVIGACSFLGGATGQLTVLFGTNGATYAASACAIISGLAGVFLMATTGQSSQVKTVAAMPGVDRITVNNNATPVLAAMAVDQSVNKIGPSNGNIDTLKAIAKSAA